LNASPESSSARLDLAIAYRVYPRVSGSPALHAGDKFQLVKLCLASFKRALGSLRVKIWLLLDGCPPSYEDLFRQYFREDEIEVVNLAAVGNEATFAMQVDILARQSLAELVYFAEDDYFYLPNAIVEMVEFAGSGEGIDFVTPYDHPDRYQDSTRRQRAMLRAFGRRHWRTASSTCLTFLATRNALVQNRALFRTFRRGAHDCAIWQAITQKVGLFDPRVHAANSDRFKIWLNTWFRGYRRILFGRSYKLWSPIPGVATHMALPYLSPVVDWYAEFSHRAVLAMTVSGHAAVEGPGVGNESH
jgi:hypothetical protein